ncbi:MAG: PQQ-binding-like beta-propeller repeat protein [Limisphaerales bacterium]
MKFPPILPWLGLCAVLAAAQVQAADWPQRRGPANDGHSAETGWSHVWTADGPPVAWRRDVGTGFSAVTVAGGVAFVVGNASEASALVALDAASGEPRWSFTYPEPLNPKMYEGGPNVTPTVAGGRLFAASRPGLVLCLDAASGSLVWSNDLARVVGGKNGDWGMAGAPLVSGGRVFVNFGTAVVALDASTGQAQWQAARETKGKYSFTTPVLAQAGGRPLLLAHMQKALFGLDPADGRALWRHEFGAGYETHCTDPVLTDTGAFISSGDDGGELVAFTTGDVRRVWKNKNLGTFTGTAVLVGGHLYGVDAAGYKKGGQELRCVSSADGAIRWSLPGFGQDSLIAAGDRLILLSERGELMVVRATPERPEVLARAQVLGGKCWTQPTLADARLYCRNAKGQIICLDLRPPAS